MIPRPSLRPATVQEAEKEQDIEPDESIPSATATEIEPEQEQQSEPEQPPPAAPAPQLGMPAGLGNVLKQLAARQKQARQSSSSSSSSELEFEQASQAKKIETPAPVKPPASIPPAKTEQPPPAPPPVALPIPPQPAKPEEQPTSQSPPTRRRIRNDSRVSIFPQGLLPHSDDESKPNTTKPKESTTAPSKPAPARNFFESDEDDSDDGDIFSAFSKLRPKPAASKPATKILLSESDEDEEVKEVRREPEANVPTKLNESLKSDSQEIADPSKIISATFSKLGAELEAGCFVNSAGIYKWPIAESIS